MELLVALIAAPFILMLVGIVKLFNATEIKRKSGGKLLLIGIALLGVEILIGYSICSNMSFGGN